MADIQHSGLTSAADIHEPKGAYYAKNGEVYVADGGGSGAFLPNFKSWSFSLLQIPASGSVSFRYPFNTDLNLIYTTIRFSVHPNFISTTTVEDYGQSDLIFKDALGNTINSASYNPLTLPSLSFVEDLDLKSSHSAGDWLEIELSGVNSVFTNILLSFKYENT